jgi:hypothetical protein
MSKWVFGYQYVHKWWNGVCFHLHSEMNICVCCLDVAETFAIHSTWPDDKCIICSLYQQDGF